MRSPWKDDDRPVGDDSPLTPAETPATPAGRRDSDGDPSTPAERRESRIDARRKHTSLIEKLAQVKPEDIEKLAERDPQDAGTGKLLKPVVQDNDGTAVLREDLENYLQNQLERDRTCRKIPFTVLYFVFFDVMLLLHQHISDASQAERQVRDILTGSSYEGYAGPTGPGSKRLSVSGHKFLDDMSAPSDFYTYAREVAIPMMIPPPGSAQVDANHRVLRYHQLIGGVLLEQIRRGKRNCASLYPRMGPKNDFQINPFLVDFFCHKEVMNTDDCFGMGTSMEGFCKGNITTNGLEEDQEGRRLLQKHRFSEEVPGSQKSRLVESVDVNGPRYSLLFHEHQGRNVALERLGRLDDVRWIDEQTSWVGLKVFLLNPDLMIYTFARVNAYFLLSGELTPVIEATTFVAEPYQYKVLLVVDIIWALFLLELFVSCTWSLCSSMRRKKQMSERLGCRAYLRNIWVWVDWACALGGGAVVLLWLVYLGKLDDVKQASLGVAIARPDVEAAAGGSEEVMRTYVSWVGQLHASVEDLASYLSFLRFFFSCYNVFLMARFFEAFQTQPRLAIVTHTLFDCLPDFLHFMIVFTVMLLAYAVAGTFLFGHRLPEFSRVHLSLERCLLMIFGDIDYPRLAAEYPTSAFIWFMTFCILLFLVMMNMSLAVVLDVYAGHISKVKVSESLWQQVAIALGRRKVTATKLLSQIEKLDDMHMISTKDLKVLFPHVKEDILKDLLAKVIRTAEEEYQRATTITDATRVVVLMKRHVAKVTAQVDALIGFQQQTHRQMQAALASFTAVTNGEVQVKVRLDGRSDRRLSNVERRLDALEGLMDDVMKYTENRALGLADRLKALEDVMRVACRT